MVHAWARASPASSVEEATADDLHATHYTCLLRALLTLHRLDKVLDGVGPDTECRTFLHELGWNMVVGI